MSGPWEDFQTTPSSPPWEDFKSVPFQKRTGQDEAAHGTLSEWKPSLGERITMAAPSLFSGEVQPATGMPRGLLPRVGQVASSFLHFAPLSAEQWTGQPPQNVAQGVTEGVAKQITPANIGIGLAAAPLFLAKEATVPITLAKSIIAAYFAKQGAETAGTEYERMTRPQAIDPTLTPGQRAEAGMNVGLGGLVGLAPAFPHPPTAKFFTPEDVQRYSVNPEGFEKRPAQAPPVILGQQERTPNAIQEREAETVPMGPPPGDSGQVESRVRREGVQQAEGGQGEEGQTTQDDVSRYQELVGQMRTNPTTEAWQELEAIKNKYGGMPPIERQVIESGEEKGQTQEQERVLKPQEQEPPSTTKLYGGFFPLDPDFWRTQIGIAKDVKVDAQQMYNRIRNKLGEGSSAWQTLNTPEFKAAFMGAGKMTTDEAREVVERVSPKVEVRKFSDELSTKKNKTEAEYRLQEAQNVVSQIHHRVDTVAPGWRISEDGYHIVSPDNKSMTLSQAFEPPPYGRNAPQELRALTEQMQLAGDRLYAAQRGVETAHPVIGETHWGFAGPKPEDQMKHYVEVAVKLPDTETKGEVLFKDYKNHPGGDNTLGFFRGYVENVNGKKVFRVIEVQSDWAARRREQQANAMPNRTFPDTPPYVGTPDHPLLRDWERLTVKAAIDHAVKEGADAVAFDDPETAMMTEGHDRGLLDRERRWSPPLTEEELQQRAKEILPDQAKGMMLHYGTILPKLGEELTGTKGVRQEFGEHKMAVEEFRADDENIRAYPGQGVNKQPRKDLIFRNPDGTPKTTSSGMMFDLGNVKGKDWSILQSDKVKTKAATTGIGGGIQRAVEGGQQFSKSLESDIRHKLESSKSSVEEGEAPLTRNEAIKELMQDSDEVGHYAYEHRKELQDYGIKTGIYKEISKQELDNTQTIGRGKKYDFKRGDKYYVFNSWKPLEGGGIGGGIRQAVEGGSRSEEGAVNLQVVRDAINAVYDKVGEGVDAVKDLFGDKPFRTAMMRMSGVAAPHTTRRMPIVGNQLVMTAKANDIVELVKKDLVNQVLGSRYKDPEFDKLVGAVGVEDNLRAKGAKNVASGLPSGVTSVVGQPWSPIKTEAQYQQLKNATAIKEALEKHKQLIQPEAEQRHVALGGKLRQGGLETDAFFNLIPVQQATKPGATSGQLATLKKGSMFGRQFKGTAPEYDLSYRNMAERMVAGNWFEMEKQRLFNLAESTGFGKVQRSGAPIPTFDKPMEPIPIQRKQIVYQKQGGPGKTVVKNETLWVPKDTAEEFRQAFQTDSPLAKALRIPGKLLTEAQISLGADAFIHISNMAAGILTAPEKVAAVKNTFQNLKRVWDNDASVQHDLAELARKYGIVRAGHPSDASLLRKILQPGSGAIRFFDKVARLTMNQLYQESVNRGKSPDLAIWRRASVHGAIGEYNVRLLTKLQQQLKEAGVSPFIVAGKTFNRLSIRQLTMAPGRKAVDVKAGAEMRARQALYIGAAVLVTPMVINTLTSGNPFGPPGTDVGQIYLGRTKTGKSITFDVAKLLMLRRGMRISGLQAVTRGIEQGQSVGQIAKGAATDIARGVAQPYAGPLVSAEEMVRTGKDFMQYRRAQDQSLGGRLKEAVKEANPMTATLLGKSSEGDLGERTLSRLGRVGAVMTGPSPVSTIKTLAIQFNEREGQPIEDHPASQYKELSNALRGNDAAKVRTAVADLQKKGVRNDTIKKYYDELPYKNVTGRDAAAEARFVAQLKPDQKKVYDQVVAQEFEAQKNFYNIILQRPAPPHRMPKRQPRQKRAVEFPGEPQEEP